MDATFKCFSEFEVYLWIICFFSVRNPPPYCFAVPYLKEYASICLRLRKVGVLPGSLNYNYLTIIDPNNIICWICSTGSRNSRLTLLPGSVYMRLLRIEWLRGLSSDWHASIVFVQVNVIEKFDSCLCQFPKFCCNIWQHFAARHCTTFPITSSLETFPYCGIKNRCCCQNFKKLCELAEYSVPRSF